MNGNYSSSPKKASATGRPASDPLAGLASRRPANFLTQDTDLERQDEWRPMKAVQIWTGGCVQLACGARRRPSLRVPLSERLTGPSTASTVWSVDHAVVVGAGIGGLTASLVLSRVAARVTLVERAERPSEVGAALALQPNGMAVLERLGLLSAVEAVGARIDKMDIRSVTGRRLLTAGMPDLGAGLDEAIAIRRTDLHRLLLRLSPAWP